MKAIEFTDNGGNVITIQAACKKNEDAVTTAHKVRTELVVLMNEKVLDSGEFDGFPLLKHDVMSGEYIVSPHYSIVGQSTEVEERISKVRVCFAQAVCECISREELASYYTYELNYVNKEIAEQREILAACLEQEQREGYMFTSEDVYKKRLKWKKDHGDNAELMPTLYCDTDRNRANELLKNGLLTKCRALETAVSILADENICAEDAILAASVIEEIPDTQSKTTAFLERAKQWTEQNLGK